MEIGLMKNNVDDPYEIVGDDTILTAVMGIPKGTIVVYNNRPIGIAAHDFRDGDTIQYQPGINTGDVWTHGGNSEWSWSVSVAEAGEDLETFQAVYLDADGKARAADAHFLEVPAGLSLSKAEDDNAPT